MTPRFQRFSGFSHTVFGVFYAHGGVVVVVVVGGGAHRVTDSLITASRRSTQAASSVLQRHKIRRTSGCVFPSFVQSRGVLAPDIHF